jgi:N-methylhydantoinase A/oxoprolinase/acetone carboxylase beta subunit
VDGERGEGADLGQGGQLLAAQRDARGEESGERRVFFYGTGWAAVPVYHRDGLDVGDAIPGPAIVEDEWSTTLVYPGQRCCADRIGHLIIEVNEGA